MTDDIRVKTASKMLELLETHNEELIADRPEVTGIQDAQYRLLFHLLKFPMMSMTALGKSMYFTKAYMTTLVDCLVEEGCVERHPDPNDRRVINIQITEAGKEKLENARDLLAVHLMKKLSGISPKDMKIILSSIEKLLNIYMKYKE